MEESQRKAEDFNKGTPAVTSEVTGKMLSTIVNKPTTQSIQWKQSHDFKETNALETGVKPTASNVSQITDSILQELIFDCIGKARKVELPKPTVQDQSKPGEC